MEIDADRRHEHIYYDGKTFSLVPEKAGYYAQFAAPPTLTALKDALESVGRIPVSQGVLNYTPTDHFGFTPDTGVLVTVANGDWKLVPTK